MPEAAMNEDYGAILRENEIGFAGQALVMKNVTEAACMQPLAHNHLRLRVFSPDAGHHPASHFRRDDVSHLRKRAL